MIERSGESGVAGRGCSRLRGGVVYADVAKRIDYRSCRQHVLDRESHAAISTQSAGGKDGDADPAAPLDLRLQNRRGGLLRSGCAGSQYRRERRTRRGGGIAGKLINPDHNVGGGAKRLRAGRPPVEANLVFALFSHFSSLIR